MPEMSEVEVVCEGLAFPEGPVELPGGAVAVVEMMAGRVSRIDRDGAVSVLAEVGGGPNGAAIGPDGALYVCNNGGMTRDRIPPCIQRVDPATGDFQVLYSYGDEVGLVSPNDLVFDAAGGFWFTDFGGDAIYYAQADGSAIRRVVSRVPAPNGIGLSPDGDVLYWAQTYTRQVHRRLVAGPGQIIESPPHSLVPLLRGQTPDPWTLLVGLPGREELDSLAVDSAGAVCVGTLLDGGITVVDPSGGGVEKYTLPDNLADGAVTNICFGGADLRTALITCSVSGRLVSCRWPRPGLRLAYQGMPV